MKTFLAQLHTLRIEWKDPSWYRSFCGWCISWWFFGSMEHWVTLFGFSISWWPKTHPSIKWIAAGRPEDWEV